MYKYLICFSLFNNFVNFVPVLGKISSKLKILRNRHKMALELQDHQISEKDSHWCIMSALGKELCQIERSYSACSCDLRCVECEACIHSFLCSCPDNLIKWNMCKHIHILCQYLKQQAFNVDIPTWQDNVSVEQPIVMQVVPSPKVAEQHIIIRYLIYPLIFQI